MKTSALTCPAVLSFSSRLFSTLLATTLLLAVSAATRADVLVLTDGSQIKTQGAFEVDGRRVLYTSMSGNLSAIRLTNVDMEASRQASEALNNPKPAPGPQPDNRPAALTLEDGDVGTSRGRVMSLEALFASGHRLADEVWALSSAYDMTAAEGVTKAVPSLEALAHRWRQQATEARGMEGLMSSDGAATAEALAELARRHPEQLARQWPAKPPGESASD